MELEAPSPQAARVTGRAERELSERALNRALLARQRLLEDAGQPPEGDRTGRGLQTQYAPAGTSLCAPGWRLRTRRPHAGARTEAGRPGLDDADHDPHGLPRTGSSPPRPREPRRAIWRRGCRRSARRRASGGPRSSGSSRTGHGVAPRSWRSSARQRDLVRRGPVGRSRAGAAVGHMGAAGADLYGLARTGSASHLEVSEEEGSRPAGHRYLGAFGRRHRRTSRAGRGSRLDAAREGSRLRISSTGSAERSISPRPAPRSRDARAGPLPRRVGRDAARPRVGTQVLPERHARVFNTKMPQSVNTFLVDGQVAGSWRDDEAGSSSIRSSGSPRRIAVRPTTRQRSSPELYADA